MEKSLMHDTSHIPHETWYSRGICGIHVAYVVCVICGMCHMWYVAYVVCGICGMCHKLLSDVLHDIVNYNRISMFSTRYLVYITRNAVYAT